MGGEEVGGGAYCCWVGGDEVGGGAYCVVGGDVGGDA